MSDIPTEQPDEHKRMRQMYKTATFMSLYSSNPHLSVLSATSACSSESAKNLLDHFKRAYPTIGEWMDKNARVDS